MTVAAPAHLTAAQKVWAVALRLIRMELRIYASIGRFLARRPAIPAGGTGVGYHKPVLTILVIFIVLSAIEIPILDLIVHRWPPVRIGFLILGIWGLTWMLGLLCAYLTRPHTVGPEGLQVREGLEIDIPLAWDDVASVSRARHVDEPKSPRITDAGGNCILSLRMQDETNVEIRLERPTPVVLPGSPPKGGAHAADLVRIWVDDLDAYMAAVRQHIP